MLEAGDIVPGGSQPGKARVGQSTSRAEQEMTVSSGADYKHRQPQLPKGKPRLSVAQC